MDVLPRRNLSKNQEPWGRAMDNVTLAHDRDIEALKLFYSGLNRATAGQMGVIGANIADIEAQQTIIQTQQGELATQQGELATQQSQLQTQQATLNSQQTTLGNQQTQLSTQITELNYRTNAQLTAANLSVSSVAAPTWAFATRNITIAGKGGVARMAYVAVYANGALTGSGQGAIQARLTQGGRILGESSRSAEVGYGFSSVIEVPAGGTTVSIRIGIQRFSGTPGYALTNIVCNVLYGGPR